MSNMGSISKEITTHLEEAASDDFRSRQCESLNRVLASNMIHQLMEAGHRRDELIGFAAAVLSAINEGGDGAFPRTGQNGTPACSTFLPSVRSVVFEEGPRIIGKRTLLRLPQKTEAPLLKRWIRDPLIQQSLFQEVLQHVIHHLTDPDEQDDRLDLIVCERAGGHPIGLVSLHQIDRTVGQAELGKMIGEAQWRGKGIALESTQMLLLYAFEHLNLNRVYLRTLGGNLKNIKLNERVGFRFEGVLRQAGMANGHLSDVVHMGMLQKEFLAIHGSTIESSSVLA